MKSISQKMRRDTLAFLWGNAMGKSSQRKGANGERELATILQAHGYPVERGGSLTFGGVPDLTGLPGVHCEVKRVQNLNLCAALRQASEDAQYFEDGLPCVFHRRNREGWLCTMWLDDWLQLYQAAKPEEIRERG